MVKIQLKNSLLPYRFFKFSLKPLVWLMLGSLGISDVMGQDVDRVVLFMIDGLHWEAPSKIEMPVFNSLIPSGTYINKSYMIIPHHPTIGDYSKYNSCSFPNPMLHAGTAFIKPENKFIQEVISPERKTAFVVNSTAYRSVARGFTTSIMDVGLTDREVVEQSMNVIENQDPAFIRIHLQTPGEMGRSVSEADPNKPFFRAIFGKGSPYVNAVENADALLGEFITYLKQSNKWDGTVLIVSSDHGQSKSGWHPMFDYDSWTTPLLFVGPGIAKNRTLSYFEHIDLAPTIAWLLDKPKPNDDGGSGKIVKEILEKHANRMKDHQYIKTINEQIITFNLLKASLTLKSPEQPFYAVVLASLENEFITEEPFYHQDRIMDWYSAKTLDGMIKANAEIIKQMETELKK